MGGVWVGLGFRRRRRSGLESVVVVSRIGLEGVLHVLGRKSGTVVISVRVRLGTGLLGTRKDSAA